jgi:hypothetical protein
LSHNRQYQSGKQRTQIAGRRQYQEATGTASGQYHSSPEHETTYQTTRKATIRSKLASSGDVKQTKRDEGLRRSDSG